MRHLSEAELKLVIHASVTLGASTPSGNSARMNCAIACMSFARVSVARQTSAIVRPARASSSSRYAIIPCIDVCSAAASSGIAEMPSPAAIMCRNISSELA
jgi:hypothetical protein